MSSLAFLLLMSCGNDYELKPGPVDVDPGDVTACGFTRVESSSFYRYDCNPVFPPRDADGAVVGEAWASDIGSVAFHVTEVVDHPFYQAWYLGRREDGYGLGYAVSAEGTAWETHPDNPLLDNPSPTSWDADSMDGMQVVWDTDTEQYVMLYQGFNVGAGLWGLGVATSPDGTDWTRLPSNPVIDFTSLDASVKWCWPLGLSRGAVGGFTGYIAGGPNDVFAVLEDQICEAYTINASTVNNWEPRTNEVVFPVGSRGEWDDQGIASMAIAELNGARYLFYVAFGRWVCQPSGRDSDRYDECTFGDQYVSGDQSYFGYAVEEDGRWVRRGKVPLHMNPEGGVAAVGAQTVGSRIHLWVTDDYDGSSAIGYFLFDPKAAREEDEAAEARR